MAEQLSRCTGRLEGLAEQMQEKSASSAGKDMRMVPHGACRRAARFEFPTALIPSVQARPFLPAFVQGNDILVYGGTPELIASRVPVAQDRIRRATQANAEACTSKSTRSSVNVFPSFRNPLRNTRHRRYRLVMLFFDQRLSLCRIPWSSRRGLMRSCRRADARSSDSPWRRPSNRNSPFSARMWVKIICDLCLQSIYCTGEVLCFSLRR